MNRALLVVPVLLLSAHAVSAAEPDTEAAPAENRPGTPSLEKVIDEGVAAYVQSVEGKDEAQGFDAGDVMARSLLTTALIGAGRREEVDALDADQATKRQLIAVAEDSLFEVTGKVPTIAAGTPPPEELLRRLSWGREFARRGDFQRAYKQVAALPRQIETVYSEIRFYRFVVEQQLERKDVGGARKTLKKVAAMIRDVEFEKPETKADYLLDLARLSCQAGEEARARRACRQAEEMLRPLFRVDEQRPYGIGISFRELATLQAECGEVERAQRLLEFWRRRVAALEDEHDKADLLFELEIAAGRVAARSGRKEDALAAYDRALKWGIRAVELETPSPLTDVLRESELLNAMMALADNSHFNLVALEQLKAGDLQAALKTWQRMPLCFNKPSTLLEMAKILHQRGDTDEARKLATRCAEIIQPESAAEDYVLVTAFVANIYRAIGDKDAARNTLAALAASSRVKESTKAQQMVAAELINFHLYSQAYAFIQTIPSPADRALPLARLAEAMVKAEIRSP